MFSIHFRRRASRCLHQIKKMGEKGRVLIVRRLPSEFNNDDKEELLKYFGATQVNCLGPHGHMKNVAFAIFEDHEAAQLGLQRLHQLQILNCVLNVEFSNSQMSKYLPSELVPIPLKEESNDAPTPDKEHEEQIRKKKREILREVNNIASHWGIEYSFDPKLKYSYPPPTVSILTNIANALASVPRFYVQVLHLMNKMNLPAPFGPVTTTPPIPEGAPHSQQPPPLPNEPPIQDSKSDEESELESEDGDAEIDQSRIVKKRPLPDKLKTWSRHKIQKTIPTTRQESAQPQVRPDEMFELPQSALQKKIELRIPSAISQSVNEVLGIQRLENQSEQVPVSLPQGEELMQSVPSPLRDQDPASAGFGTMAPVPVEPKDSSSEDENEEWTETKFISSRRLRKGRLSSSQMKEFSVFKKYESGEPTTRLYIKNLSKQTTEKDLHYIFGRYVDWENEVEKLMFDIRLMKEGRMKGQAFITLPNAKCAKDALNETNTYVLQDKPMVVQFARSAKAKETEPSKS